MGPKKMSAKDSGEKKKRMMSIEVKQEITEKHERASSILFCLFFQILKIYSFVFSISTVVNVSNTSIFLIILYLF